MLTNGNIAFFCKTYAKHDTLGSPIPIEHSKLMHVTFIPLVKYLMVNNGS